MYAHTCHAFTLVWLGMHGSLYTDTATKAWCRILCHPSCLTDFREMSQWTLRISLSLPHNGYFIHMVLTILHTSQKSFLSKTDIRKLENNKSTCRTTSQFWLHCPGPNCIIWNRCVEIYGVWALIFGKSVIFLWCFQERAEVGCSCVWQKLSHRITTEEPKTGLESYEKKGVNKDPKDAKSDKHKLTWITIPLNEIMNN